MNRIACTIGALLVPWSVMAHEITPNWSGYVLPHYQSGRHYEHISGTWTVPTPQWGRTDWNPLGHQYNTIWVGIGGWYTDPSGHSVDQNLIQIGTESIVDQAGRTHHYAWYELFPANSVLIDRPVRAGDDLTASITCVADCASDRKQTWKLVISNNTHGWNWTKTVPFKTPMESAEWIVESTGDAKLPLNDYGRIEWSDLIVNHAPAELTVSVASHNPKSNQTSTPSVPSGNSFSTCWGFGSLTRC